MSFVSVLGFTHQLLAQHIQSGEIAIDATLGTGVDALYLAKLVGQKGRLFGFDIQPQALDQTWVRLRKEFPDASSFVKLHLCSHERMAEQIPTSDHGSVAAVTFNLGYLPGADPSTKTITQEASTLPALEASLKLLRRRGIVTIVLYTGHAGGSEEAAAVELWAHRLSPAEYQVLRYQFVNPMNHPYLLAIEKK
jgi:SAM-dependent methyltransferase